jgi:hypothetical protein
MTNHEKQMAAIERQCKAANCGCVPERLRQYIEYRQKSKVQGLDDVIHGLNGDVELRLSDLVALLAAAPTEGARDAGVIDILRKMTEATLEDALGPNHLALCLKQMANEALDLATEKKCTKCGHKVHDGSCVNVHPSWERDADLIAKHIGNPSESLRVDCERMLEEARDAGVGTAVAWRWKTPTPEELGGSYAWSFGSHWSTGPKDRSEPLYAHPDPLLAEAVEALEKIVAFWDSITMEDCVNTLHVDARAILAKVQAAKEQAS